MLELKKYLGLALLLTIVWLQHVLLTQVGEEKGTLSFLLLSLILIFFAFYLKNLPRKIFAILALFGLFQTFTLISGKETLSGEIPWRPWSPEVLSQLQAEQKLVFMDFTAQWCFNCKVNEKLVLHTNSFQELARELDMTLLEADWTSYDPVIGDWLKSRGVFGVPAYFLQLPSGEIVSLGETVTIKKIRRALSK